MIRQRALMIKVRYILNNYTQRGGRLLLKRRLTKVEGRPSDSEKEPQLLLLLQPFRMLLRLVSWFPRFLNPNWPSSPFYGLLVFERTRMVDIPSQNAYPDKALPSKNRVITKWIALN